MKKILSVLLCICMVMTLIPATVMASGTDSNKYVIDSTDPTEVQAEFGDAAEVTKDGETIVIKLLKDLDRNLHIGNEDYWSGELHIILDLNGKTIAPVNSDPYTYTIFFDNSFDDTESTFIITGSGTLKGVDNNEALGYITNAGAPGVRFKLAAGCEYFTLKLDGEDYLDNEQNTGEQEPIMSFILGSELVMTQVGGNGDGGDGEDNTELEYYLVGKISMVDTYECKEGYKFVDGKLDIVIDNATYVGVMDSEGNFYFPKAWIDFDATEGVLYSGYSSVDAMHIGNSGSYTLWLTVNADGTLTLRTFDPSTIEEFEATATLMYGAYYNDIPYVGIMVEATGIPATATEYGVKIDGYKYPATSKLVNGKFVVDVANSPRALIADTGYNAKVYYTENGEDVYAEDGLNFFTPASMLDNDGYYYADGDNIGYKYNYKGIDVMGKDGTDSWIQSTYDKAGWPMAYGNTSTVYHSSPAANSVYSGDINAWVVPEISEDGYFVKVKYFIRNVTDAEITDFRFGASADVQIGSQDSAPIRKTEYGLELSDGTNTFALLLNEGYVEIPVTTQWFGYFNVAYDNVYNVIDSDSYNSGDSGAAYSWQNITLAPGEIKCYEVMLGVGDSNTLGSILTPSADIEYEDEALLDLEAGELYKISCDGVTYEITAESDGSIALAGKDNNNADYNFIGKTISVVEVVDGEESAPQEVTIANRPVAVVPAKIVGDGEIELPDELDVVTTDTTITIKADENQVYSIDNGTTWVTPTEGSVTFAGLTDGTTYTILTKVNATSTSFASLNAEFEVKAAKMFDASDVEITGTSIVYDGEAHGITAQAEDAEAMYSSALNASYTSECPTYTNVGTYSIYYKISKEGYHDYYGVGTLEILPKKINTTIELTAPVANAAPMLNVENEEYTAVVVWSPAVMDKFDYSTAYTANITVTPKANYTLTGVTENEFVITGATVTNAADSGDVTAVFEATGAKRTGGGGGVSRYTVKFDTNGGTTVANKTVTRNSKLAEPTAPVKDGYTFDGWYTDKELTTAYDFDAKVTKSFTLYAKWVEAKATHVCPSEKFSDLDTTKWYHEDIDYVLDNEIMLGTSETVFAPEGSLTRGMLVTILYRSEGEPATNKSIPFADVDMGAYYTNAVVWAQQNGIVKGISETEYAPDMNVTREQLATIMFRYAQFKGMDAVTAEENLGFNDASDISDWAVAAMNWGVGRDYIFSRTEGSIAPRIAATRAEIAAFIHRYIVDNVK